MYLLMTALWLLPALFQPQEKEDQLVLVWSDEFDRDGMPDPDKWTYDIGDGCPDLCGWGNKERQYYTSDYKNVRVSGGKLIIEAHNDAYEESAYTSAKVRANEEHSVKYGYIEVKAKLPYGRGTWPAIWMLPQESSYGQWPASGEIDIMEHVGYDPGVVHGTIHTEAFNHAIGTQVGKHRQVKDFSHTFHRYAVNWTKDAIEFYIDGDKYNEFKNNGAGPEAWPFDHSFYLIMNIAVGGMWGGRQGIDESIWPQRMEVDYVRVYEPLYSDVQKLALKNNNRRDEQK